MARVGYRREKFLDTLVSTTAAIAVLGALVGVPAAIYAHKHNASEKRTAAAIVQRDAFYVGLDQVAQGKPSRFEGSNAAERLINDLRPFLVEEPRESKENGSGLLPTALTKAYVAPGTYKGIEKALRLNVFDGIGTGSSTVCQECGYLSDKFLADLATIRSGELDTLLTNPAPAPAGPHVFGRDLTWGLTGLYVSALWLLAGLLGFAIARVNDRSDRSYYSYRNSDPDDTAPVRIKELAPGPKLAVVAIAPYFAIPAVLAGGVGELREKRALAREARLVRERELAAIAANPAGATLLELTSGLNRLLELPEAERTPEVRAEIEASKAAIDELRGVTGRIKAVGANQLADEVRRVRESAADHELALIEGVREAAKIGKY